MTTAEERLARAQANSPKTYALLHGTQTPAQVAKTVSAPVNNSFQTQGNIYTDKNVPKEVQAAASQITKPLTYDMTADINKLTEISQQKRISELAKARDTALSNLNREKAGIQPMYYDRRAQTSTASQLGARNFAEFLASRGQTKAGFSAQAELNRGMTLQNNIGALNRQEQTAYDDIARRTTDTNNDFASDVANASMGIEADKLKMLMDAREKERALTDSRNAQLGKVIDPTTGKLVNTAEQETRVKQDYANSVAGLGDQMDYQGEINKLANDGDTSNDWRIAFLQKEREKKIQNSLQDQIKNIGQYYNDYDAEIKRRQATPDKSDDNLIPYLQTARQEKLVAIQQAEAKANEAQREQYLKVFQETGIVSTQEMANALGLPIGTTTSDYKKTMYDINKPYYKPSSGGGSGSSGSSYSSVNKAVANAVKSYSNNPNVNVKGEDGSSHNFVFAKGSVEYNNIADIIYSSGLSDADQMKIFIENGLPY